MDNTLIRQSHERCILLKTDFNYLVEKDKVNSNFDIQLNNITWNCIRNIRSSFFTLYNTFFTLSNKDLLVINHFVNKNSNIDMNKYIPPIGTSLKEENYGTSATSIARLKGDVAYVVKSEHFIKKSKDLSCVAAPLKSGDDIVGYLSLSTLDSKQINVLRVFIESLSINIGYELRKYSLLDEFQKNISSNEDIIMNKKILDFLTDSERDVLKFVFQNYSNDMIAKNMYISETAIRKILLNIYKKMGTKNKIDTIISLVYKDIFSII